MQITVNWWPSASNRIYTIHCMNERCPEGPDIKILTFITVILVNRTRSASPNTSQYHFVSSHQT